MQIRDLERTLGIAVVERRPGDVILTDVGAVAAEEPAAGTSDRPRVPQHLRRKTTFSRLGMW
jgi:LysR family transcriptional regulator, hydrogen peroxide-inducible genes activator